MNWDKTNGERASLIPVLDFSSALNVKRESTLDFGSVLKPASKIM